MTLNKPEKNLLEIAGLAAKYPTAAFPLISDITFQTRLFLKNSPVSRVILEISLDHAGTSVSGTDNPEPLEPAYVRIRTQEQTGDPDGNLLIIHHIFKSGGKLAATPQEAAWRIQEKLIENLPLIPQNTADNQITLRQQINSAQRILAKSRPPETLSTTPLAGLLTGETLETPRLPRRPSGIRLLDQESLNGGLIAGTSTIIAGMTNTGKTYLTYHMLLEELWAGGTIMIVSLEDDTNLTTLRWYSYLLGKHIPEIENLSDEEITQAFHEKYDPTPEKLQALKRIILWCPGSANTPTAAEICRRITQEEETRNTTITRYCVDYIQNISTAGETGETETQKLTNAANRLYDFTSKTKKNLFLISQGRINDNNAKGDFLELHDALANATAIGRNAHYIITLKTPAREVERRFTSCDKRSKINIATRKTKFGTPHAVFAIFDGKKWGFTNSTQEREQVWDLTAP